MHYSIILNPNAGNGYAKQIWPAIKAQLDERQSSYDYQISKPSQPIDFLTRKIIQAHPNPADTTVIAIGGDGTLHDTLNGLIKAENGGPKIPLAFIPAGSYNNFARGYGISSDPAKALSQILAANTIRQVNLGHYQDAIKHQDGYFLNSIGIGFDAAIVSQINRAAKNKRRRKRTSSHFKSFSRALGVLYNQQAFSLMVQGEHGREYFPKAYIVIANNHPFIGEHFKLAPTASLDENALDLTIAERKNWLLTFWQLHLLNRGKLTQSRFATHFHAKRFHFNTTSLEFGQVDGKEMGNRFMDITLSTSQYPFRQAEDQQIATKQN